MIMKLGQRGGSPTLNVFDNSGDTRATVLIIDGTRVGDVRIYEDEIMQTVIQRWGTGGGNVPYVFTIENGEQMQDPIVFEPGALGRLDGKRSSTEVVHTLRAQMGDNLPAVAYSIREDAKANNFSATEIETARALQSLQPSVQSHHAQTFIAETNEVTATLRSGGDGGVPSSRGEHLVVTPTLSASNNPSRSPQSSEVTAQVAAMVEATSTVRRLTPTECERLQGFPDGWTDNQADSNRYKQMGNAVTVNVIEWIGARL